MEAEMEPSSSKKSKSASPMPSPLNLQAKKTGVTLFWQQFRALMKKNYLLALRSKRSTVLQVGSSLFFIFLIFAVDQALQAQRKSTTAFQNVFDPEAVPVTAIPRCEDGFFIKSPCYDFLWTPTGNPKIAQIVEGIRNRNPGRPIPPEKVLGFSNRDEVDQWLLDNPMRCIGALHFEENVPNVISYGLQTNSTVKNKRGIFEDAVFKFMIPFQMAAEREIVRFVTNDANIDWSVSFKEFAHPAFTVFSTVGTVGPIFLLAAAMFGFVIQISNLVSERELKLRQAMSIMGLMDSAYWCSWLIWEVFIALLSSILLVLFGMMFQFDFFLNNSFGVLFFMFFLFQFNMIGFAFMISAFVSKATSARTVGFVIYVFGFVTQLVTNFGFPYDNSFAKYLQVIWSIFPPNLLAVGLNYLGKATATKQDEGISWEARDRCSAADENCVLTMEDIFIWLTGLFFAWFLLAIYFDNVFADQNGVRKSCFYFLQPSYWTGRATSQVEGGGLCSCTRSLQPPPDSTPVDEDVAKEEDLVKRQIIDRDSVDSNIAVQMCGLVKTFPGVTKITGCCRCRSTDPYYAVKGLWLNIERNKLFCLLGPNGAGKTTTINCLTGILPTTGGDAIVYGESIRNAAGLSNIRSFMGVCPQFDILWSALTGLEHLKLFANIKGLSSTQISTNAEELLSHVKLNDDKNIRAGSYSGGMKRRLSVAIALIGDPKIVYLDEPTTGMDPVTRRHVWDIIESAKKGRAIILTTHSMEEADILGDRIAIMAKGKLRCIGTSIRLKSKFGSGYIVTVSLKKVKNADNLQHSDEGTSQRDLVVQFFKEKLEVDPKEENKAYISFVIPRNKEHLLVNFFTELQEREDELGISDIQVSLTTLEEVFLNIAKQAELETAAAEGRFETLILADGTTIRVPVGAQFVALPGTESAEHVHGMMMELYWQQDESGNLCLSGQSEPMPAPSPLLAAGSGRSGDVPIVVSRSGRFGSRRESIPIAWAVEQPQLAPHGNDSSVSRS